MPFPANPTPTLRCLRCKYPFRVSLDRLGRLHKCKHCDCHFRVTRNQAGGYVVREEAAPARPTPPPPRTAAPWARSGANAHEPAPTTSYPGAVPIPAPTDNPNADRTMMGKPTPATMRPGDLVLGDAEHTVMGKPVAPPTNGRPRPPAPPAPHHAAGKTAAPSSKAPVGARQPPPPRPAAPAAPTPRATGGRWKWVVGLVVVLALVLGGAAAAFYLLPFGKAAPVSLGKYGGIEIGSTGVKRVAVEYYKTDKGIVESLLDEPKDINPKIADLPDGAEKFDDRAFQQTVDQVGDYYEALRKLGVPAENILVVCSSGVLSPFKTDEIVQRNHDLLVKAIRAKLNIGKDPEFIDAHDEAKFSFEETVKPDEWDDSVLIDIGGNNIKGGGFVRKDNFLDFSVKAGASSFEKKVSKDIKDKNTGETFWAAALRLRPTELEKPLHDDLSAVDQLTKRKKVHLIGGVPWAMATYTEPEQFYAAKDAAGAASLHSKLAAADIARFDEMVRTLKPPEIKKLVEEKVAGKGKEVVDAVAENVDKIQTEVFKNPDRLVGGAQILLALDKEFALQAENKEVRSFRYGQVAWLLGYVKSRSGHME